MISEMPRRGRIIGCLSLNVRGARLNRPPTRNKFLESKKGHNHLSLLDLGKLMPALMHFISDSK